MLCVPRSCAASPWVIERTTVILSAIFAVCLRCSEKRTPSSFVSIDPSAPRYSTGANGFGSNVSCADQPPGRKMWISDCATAVGATMPGVEVCAARSLKKSPSVSPSPPISPV